MHSPDPEAADQRAPEATPVPRPDSPYWAFYDEVAAAQLLEWLPSSPSRVLDLSGDGPQRATTVRDAGHAVVRLARCEPGALPGIHCVEADARSLGWLRDQTFDAVIAESRVLSSCLATEETARDLARVLRPGGQLLLTVDSLVTGLARLADRGLWAQLADVPSADVVLVPDEDGTISRCFWPEELEGLLRDSCLEVDWVRPRSVLTPNAVERALATGGDAVMRTLVKTELALAVERQGETAGMHLVASARRSL